MKTFFVLAVLAVLWVLLASCSKDNKDDNDLDSGTDTDTDADTDSDTDTDTDTDTDGDTDTDTDTDSDTDTDTDTDSDGDWLPPGCEVVSTTAHGWSSELSFSGNRMVWIDDDETAEMPEIRLRNLTTGEESIAVDNVTSGYYDHASIWGDWIYWDWMLDGADGYSRELFRRNVVTSVQQQLTDSDCAKYAPLPGEEKVVYFLACGGETPIEMYVLTLDGLVSGLVSNEVTGNPSGYDYDGVKWVVWIDEVISGSGVNYQYKYDVINGVGPTVIESGVYTTVWPRISDGISYSGTWENPFNADHRCDVRASNLETGENTWVFQSPWDQIGGTVSGRVLAYADTEELAHNWFEDQTAHVELHDLDTGLSRNLTEIPAEYSGFARHDKYMAYEYGDTLILCDLEAGGFIDAAGHLCPESGCPELDAGVDGGK
jgi:hypothetical protein